MIRVTEPKRLKLAILASGRGSNFEAIYNAIKYKMLNAEISIVFSDNKDAKVLKSAEEKGLHTHHLDPKSFDSKRSYELELIKVLMNWDIDIIVLAGYMRLVGKTLLYVYKNKIINIHPSLLPAFPGLDAQKQAFEYGVRFSGCTVHLVDEGMDTGNIIAQSVVTIYDADTVDDIAENILMREHDLYWRVLRMLSKGRVILDGRKVICL